MISVIFQRVLFLDILRIEKINSKIEQLMQQVYIKKIGKIIDR